MSDQTPPPSSPETPRPGRSFQGASGPADDRPISEAARRIGPPVTAVTLVVTFGLLAWMAFAPTAIDGPIEDAPFALPATLLLGPGDDGCLVLVDGDGAATEHCLDIAVQDETEGRYVEAYFDQRGRLLVGEYPVLSVVDPVSGEVTGTVDTDQAPAPEPGRPLADDPQVHARGDRVYLDEDPRTYEPEPGDEQLVLDLAGPWGYTVTDATLSPDGELLVARTSRRQIVVAPVDGSAPPSLWADVPSDRWVDLRSDVRWGG